MGFRTRLRSLGKRIRGSFRSLHPNHNDHFHPCRVCVVEEAIRVDDKSVCAYHLLTRLDALAPFTSVAVMSSAGLPAVYLPSSPTNLSTRESVPSRQATPVLQDLGSDRPCASSSNNTPRWVTRPAKLCTSQMPPPTYMPTGLDTRPPACCGLVQSLQTALGHVRYAIGGHLALQLQASRTPQGQALYDAAFVHNADLTPEELASSVAARPMIVCPRSTRDVLRSWTAASGFDLDFGNAHQDGTLSPDPASLRLVVDGAPVSVYIDWVDDEHFNWAPYTVDDVPMGSRSLSVPILSLGSLFEHAVQAYSNNYDSTVERRILCEHVKVCRRILQSVDMVGLDNEAPALFQDRYATGFPPRRKTIRRKPLPLNSRHMTLPPPLSPKAQESQ